MGHTKKRRAEAQHSKQANHRHTQTPRVSYTTPAPLHRPSKTTPGMLQDRALHSIYLLQDVHIVYAYTSKYVLLYAPDKRTLKTRSSLHYFQTFSLFLHFLTSFITFLDSELVEPENFLKPIIITSVRGQRT
jgi:hypothetical protein